MRHLRSIEAAARAALCGGAAGGVHEAAEFIFEERIGAVRGVVNDPIRFRNDVAAHR